MRELQRARADNVRFGDPVIHRCRERLDERASEPNGGGWAVLLGVGHRIATGSTTREAPAPITVDHRTFLAPPGLTFPPDSRVTAVFPSDFATTVHLDPPEDAAIVAYFRERLPGWGYAMTNDNGTVLTAAGRGWAITVNAAMVIFGYSQEAAAALAPTDQDPSMWLTRADLGLRHAPLFMRYPAGTTATDVTDPESGGELSAGGSLARRVPRVLSGAPDGYAPERHRRRHRRRSNDPSLHRGGRIDQHDHRDGDRVPDRSPALVRALGNAVPVVIGGTTTAPDQGSGAVGGRGATGGGWGI